jgi:hypothetical protein
VSTLGAQRIKSVEVHLPTSGQWWASVQLEQGAVPPAGLVTLTIADLALVGSVVPAQSGLDATALPGTIIMGGAGWLTALPSPPPSWQADGGVNLLTVLRRLGAVAGQALVEPTDANGSPVNPRLGTAYAMSAGPVRAALSALVARAGVGPWWVDPLGVTRFGARTGTAAPTNVYQVTRRNLRRGVRVLGLSGIVTPFLPGNSIEGVTIGRLVVRETSGAMTAEAWS